MRLLMLMRGEKDFAIRFGGVAYPVPGNWARASPLGFLGRLLVKTSIASAFIPRQYKYTPGNPTQLLSCYVSPLIHQTILARELFELVTKRSNKKIISWRKKSENYFQK
jgi:hypothetical protein